MLSFAGKAKALKDNNIKGDFKDLNDPYSEISQNLTVEPSPNLSKKFNMTRFPIAHKITKNNGQTHTRSEESIVQQLPPGGPLILCRSLLINDSLEGSFGNCLLRVSGSKRETRFTQNEVNTYRKDCYYRYCIIGSVTGGMVYFIVLVFLILSEINIENSALRDIKKSSTYAPIILCALLVNYLVRVGISLCLNAFMILVIQVMFLALTIFGSYEFRCGRYVRGSGPTTSGGYLPMVLIGAVEDLLSVTHDEFRAQFHERKCDQPLIRSCAIFTLSEIINFIYSIILVKNTCK